MLRYENFIVEKVICKLLLESKVQFSELFKNVLNQVSNPISDVLLSLEDQDKNITQNYIDVDSSSTDMVSFIQDRRAIALLSSEPKKTIDTQLGKHLKVSGFSSEKDREENTEIYKSLGLNIEECKFTTAGDAIKVTGEIVSPYSGNTFCSYQSISDPTKKAVINKKGIVSLNDNSKLPWIESRNKMKIGRLAKSLLTLSGENFTDADIENFVNDYKSTIKIINDEFSKFDIVTGNDIIHFYGVDQYSHGDGKGELGNSCMRDVPSEYLQIYKDNPEVCSLVILYDDNGIFRDGKYRSEKIVGRSLLWTDVDGDRIMDRIYTALNDDDSLFKKYAEHMGWKTRHEKTIIVQLQRWQHLQYYPYMDTLDHLNSKTGKLADNARIIQANRYISSTDGDWTPE